MSGSNDTLNYKQESSYLHGYAVISVYEAAVSFTPVCYMVARFYYTSVSWLKHRLQAIDDFCPPDFMQASIPNLRFLNHYTAKKFAPPQTRVSHTLVEYHGCQFDFFSDYEQKMCLN